MNTIRNWWNGSASESNMAAGNSSAGNSTKSAQSTTQTPSIAFKASNDNMSVQQRQQEIRDSIDQVNEAKTIYDQCEQRRMTAVMNGKDEKDFSCEREFAAFKKAFDRQLYLDSKMPVTGPGVQ